jgi:cyclin B
MSSRYNVKKASSMLNKENDGALNVLKKAQVPLGKHVADKKPALKQTKSIVISQPLETSSAEKEKTKLVKVKEDVLAEQKKEERKREATKFKRSETDKVVATYGKTWITDMKTKESTTWPKNPLANHKISANVRAKMIDWMIEVLCSYKCTDMTFFVAVNYMDMYFQKTAMKHELNDLHLIGISSMYVATKYEEISPLRISVMHSKISHGKFSKEEIRNKETDILQALNFECSPITILNFLELALETIKLREVLTEALYAHLVKLSIYIAKMIMHEYELLSKYTQSEFAVACIYIALKIIQQLEPAFKIETYAYRLRMAFDVSENDFFECSQNCLDLAKGFETKYPSLTNLAKFHSFSVDLTCNANDVHMADVDTAESQ